MLTLTDLDRMAKDTGCSEHDDCLTCPLPKCRYDIAGWNSKAVKRHDAIRQLSSGLSAAEIAEQLGISIRTVQRVLKES